ncbi:MAG: hypothetical protein ACXVCY_04070 [Pseudobdellovibrionaceae bacterium]
MRQTILFVSMFLGNFAFAALPPFVCSSYRAKDVVDHVEEKLFVSGGLKSIVAISGGFRVSTENCYQDIMQDLIPNSGECPSYSIRALPSICSDGK